MVADAVGSAVIAAQSGISFACADAPTGVLASIDNISRMRQPQVFIVQRRKIHPRTEFLLQRQEQIKNSLTLSEKFPKLKLLRATVDYFDSTSVTRNGRFKYESNLPHGKSLFCFNCLHGDCVGGDYDLSERLAEAVSASRKVVEGELRCQGTRHNKERKTHTPCQGVLHFRITLGY